MIPAEHIDAARAQIEIAAFDPSKWDDALRAVASATGGRFGQLISIGDRGPPALNRIPDMDPDLRAMWDLVDGHKPSINSRLRIGGAAAPMQILDESAFTTELDSKLNPAYGDLIKKADIPFICLSTLIREPGLHIGLAVMSSQAQGNFEAENRRAFELLAQPVRRSLRINFMLEHRAAMGVIDGMEAVGLAALLCDPTGRVVLLNPTAEALLSTDTRLTLRGGKLVERASGLDYSAHVRAAVAGDAAASAPVIVRASDTGGHDGPLVLEITSLPTGTDLPYAPSVLIVIRRPWSNTLDRFQQRAVALYQLTPRETEVALGLCRGLSPQAVSLTLGMAVGTVRIHIRHLFEKTGVTSLAQLVALLRAHDS